MKHIFIALILGLTAISYGQNSISGTVTDSYDMPLAGASVYAPEIHKSTVTDADGKYTLNSVPPGQIRIIFSYIGFRSLEKNIAFRKEMTLDVIMAESVHQMDEVIVSTAFNKLQSQNVMKVEHVSVRSMQQQGVATLAEGLATIPGVSQISTGTSVGKPVIRGLSGNRVLAYSQGIRLENQQFGNEHGLGLSDSGVESVEIIKGPASLLYGSDALGGVLYFNPEKFADAKTFKANVDQKIFSNTLGSNTSIGAKGSTENWKFLARGGYATHSDYEIPDGNRVTNTRYNETDLKVGIGHSNAKVSTVFRYNFNKLDIGIPEDGFDDQTTTKSPDYPRQLIINQIFSLHNDFFFGKSKLDTDIGLTANDRSEFEDSKVASLRMKLNTLSYNIKYNLPKIGALEAIAGVQGLSQTNKNSGAEYLIPDAITNDFGIFATARYDWKNNVFQAGVRYDNRAIESQAHGIAGEEGYFGKAGRSFNSFNTSIGYKTTVDNLILRLNLASGFRAPNLAELTSNGVHEGTNRYEIGNANLSNEQNIQGDLNIEFRTDHFEFFANGFYNHINDYIYAAPTGETLEDNAVFAYVQHGAALFGGEAGIHLHPHPLDWLHFESSFETVTGKRGNGDNLPLIPASNWNNTIRMEFKLKDWLDEGYARFNVATTFDQNNVGDFETRTGGYSLVNLGFGGKIILHDAVFNVSLSANNLFDKTYVAHLSRLKPEGIPNIGRMVVCGVEFNL